MSALKLFLRSVALSGFYALFATNAQADAVQDNREVSVNLIPDVEQASQVNESTIGLVFSNNELMDSAIRELDSEVKLHAGIRLVPIMGRDDVQNVYDLLFLKGVDAAIVRSDALEYVRRRGNFPTVGNVVNAMLAVHEDKILILANKDINSINDLNGKKVVVGEYASGEYITANVLSDILGLTPELVYAEIPDGLELLKNGEASAVIFLLTAEHAEHADEEDHVDSPALTAVDNFDAGENFHALPLPVGNTDLDAVYTQSELTPDDLPNLINDGENIPTYSVDTVLAAYRWRSNNPRYEKSTRFVSAFIDSIEHLKVGKNPEFWGDLDVTAPVHGMTRLAVVDEVLIERERQIEAELQERLAQIEAAKESERLAKIARLAEQREQILDLLDKKITNASDTEELQNLLDEINDFANKLE
jgi:hypothetical protein